MKIDKHDLIVGMGNTLLSDDGIGIHIIRKMQKDGIFGNSEFLDMGTSSMELGYYIDDNIRKMVIIDSIRSDEKPGTVFKMRPGDLISKRKHDFSLHQIKLIDTLKLVSLDTIFPDTVIICIVPYDIKTFSEQLSPVLKKDFNCIYNRVVSVVEEFLNK